MAKRKKKTLTKEQSNYYFWYAASMLHEHASRVMEEDFAFVGVDPSMQSLGYALYFNEGFVEDLYGHTDVKTTKNGRFEQAVEIFNTLSNLISSQDVGIAVIEDTVVNGGFNSFTGTRATATALGATMASLATGFNKPKWFPVCLVTPSALKNFAFKGDASKEGMQEVFCEDFGFRIESDDATDAAWAALFGYKLMEIIKKYGDEYGFDDFNNNDVREFSDSLDSRESVVFNFACSPPFLKVVKHEWYRKAKYRADKLRKSS